MAKKEEQSKIGAEDILPNWIINSHLSGFIFDSKDIVDANIKESLILKIK
jgi:membrane protein required for colicin V production